ncbi:MAG TPA: MFS transporter [Candidatus Dormibacteraeota bacterium]
MIPGLVRQPGPFRVYWAGQTISLFGDQVSLIALPLVAVLVLHAGPAEMGYLVAAAWLPSLLFGLHAGAWVDRYRRRRLLMIAADIGRALLLATVPVAAALHALTFVQLLAVVFINGTLSMLFNMSAQILFVSTVPKERYVEGMSLLNGSRAFSFVSGPTVGGLLVQALSAPVALVADAISFIGSAVSLAMIAPAEPAAESERRGQVLAGIRFVLGAPVMRAALASTATINLFNLAYGALVVLYIVRSLHVPPSTLGLVLGSGAVGGLIGSLITAPLGRRIGIGPAFLLGCILFPAPLLLVPLAGGPMPVVLALLFLSQFGAGLGVMILDISVGAIFAALIPDQLRARVAGAYSVVNYGVRPVGALLGGALGAAIGTRPTLLLVTIAAIAGFLWLLPSPIRRMKTLPDSAKMA